MDRPAKLRDREVEAEDELLETGPKSPCCLDRVLNRSELRQDVVVAPTQDHATVVLSCDAHGSVVENRPQSDGPPAILLDQASVADNVRGEERNRLSRDREVVGEALQAPRLDVIASGTPAFRPPEHLPFVAT
jgi:hypothetical protein